MIPKSQTTKGKNRLDENLKKKNSVHQKKTYILEKIF